MVPILIALAAVAAASFAAKELKERGFARDPAGTLAGIARAAADPAGDAMQQILNDIRRPSISGAPGPIPPGPAAIAAPVQIITYDPRSFNPKTGEPIPMPPLTPGVYYR